MGYGILDYNGNKFKTVTYGAIETPAGIPMPERLNMIYTELDSILSEYQPEEASVEELFFNSNTTTAIAVGEARGVALLALERHGVRISEYTPLQSKQSLVGFGRAEKKQVQTMVKMILNLQEVPTPDDTADAVAAASCHAHARNSRMLE